MAEQHAGAATSADGEADKRGVRRKVVVALATVLVAQALFALCLVSALQLLVPRNAPFGMVGSSQVVAQAQTTVSLDIIAYPNQAAVIDAIDKGRLYGAYVTGASSDTLIVVPAKSFFGRIEVEPAFALAAHDIGRKVTLQTAVPLPSGDRIGAVAGLLLLPLLIGGYLAAVLVFKAAGRIAAAPWRTLILTCYAIVGALATDLIAGPWLGAYSNSHFWPLLPCFALITTAVVLAAASVQGLVGPVGTLLVALFFIVLGGVGAGGSGQSLLPVYWQNIGVVFPPQNAVTLIRNVIYFGGNDITTPLIVLFLYAIAGVVVIGYLGRIRPARNAAHRTSDQAAASTTETPASPANRQQRWVPIVAALGICLVMECLFALNYTSASHSPKATNMPFGVTGSSPILSEAQKHFSLKVTSYPNETAVKTAINEAKIWGALIPASTPGAPSTLIVVPSISDLAPLDIAVQFENAAKQVGQTVKVQQYAPVPLAKKDPFGLVQSLMLIPLLIGGYMSATLLMAATGKAAARWRLAQLLGFAIVAGLVVDLVVGLALSGYATNKFWIVWPICSLIIAVVAFVAAVLQKLIGPAGTLLTVIVIILFGNPSSGGANGVPYLPTFWRDIGPYLPPRNGYILLHQTIYFGGHGTTQSLIVLLVYLVVAGAILAVLDLRRIQEDVGADAAEAAAMAVPIGATP